MRHRDLLELIGSVRPGDAINIDFGDLADAAEDRANGAEGRCGLRAPLRTNEIRLYADGLKRYGVTVNINPVSSTITIYKPQEPTT